MEVREINDVEYTRMPERQEVQTFKVGDRIGLNAMLIMQSEEDPSDADCWLLKWQDSNGNVIDWDGDKDTKDYRWYQSLYVIEEIP